MIYSVYFDAVYPVSKFAPWGIPNNKEYDDLRALYHTPVNYLVEFATYIKESSEDTFIFIITPGQQTKFDDWISQKGLEEYIIYQMPRPITNGNHLHLGRRLKLLIMASKDHILHGDLFDETTEWSTE